MRNDRLSNNYDIHTTILSNEEVAEAHYLLRCECVEIAQYARPGQFIHVMIPQGPGLLLRRPFTIYTVEGGEITMLYQIIGDGTKHLSEMPKGARLQVLGPLGNTFNFTPKPEPAILVGGGAGIASLMLLAVALRKNGIETIGLVGAQYHARLLSISDLESIGITVHIATDDGSVGHHGYVTDLLTDLLKQRGSQGCKPFLHPTIYACGPHGMLAAVTKIAVGFEVPAQIAMENRMGCALGVCLGCVCPVRTGTNSFEYQRVCTEGPVFNAIDIVWDV
ncbi:dihydroorotate dehydrogenase electron transfer subunit [Candidatus Poribacteria bacterium]|nr:dihydroorotate dehydrogenase electron transfer subunit [Candidatus Poribacteria bacterium]MXY27536.1 dihydroorotate dehydrogenase electron transfer subunit [Candidatus Poribacteria bacterium]MYK17493.1 dihydroorotate dehydrogenase electron transfer subunit [Candidatus Poribacteria bacterium]